VIAGNLKNIGATVKVENPKAVDLAMRSDVVDREPGNRPAFDLKALRELRRRGVILRFARGCDPAVEVVGAGKGSLAAVSENGGDDMALQAWYVAKL
jgi:hypothetical protein